MLHYGQDIVLRRNSRPPPPHFDPRRHQPKAHGPEATKKKHRRPEVILQIALLYHAACEEHHEQATDTPEKEKPPALFSHARRRNRHYKVRAVSLHDHLLSAGCCATSWNRGGFPPSPVPSICGGPACDLPARPDNSLAIAWSHSRG